MKKSFLVLPLAIALVNCSSTHNANKTSASSGINASAEATAATGTNASASTSLASSGSDSMSSSNSGSSSLSGSTSTTASSSVSMNSSSATANSASWNSNAGSTPGTSGSSNHRSTARSSSGSINWDVYDPNNYMQNPEKYRKPYEMGKTGGWTYNKDWRRNTNFTADAVGQWQLVLTPEVAANWMPDTRRPETYASFWTPEAVMARYQANMAAAQRTRDSIAALNAMASANTSSRSRRGKSSLANRRNSSTAGMTASSEMNGGTWASGSGTTGTVGAGGSATVSGSGTTGTMGTGGSSSMNADSNANMGSTTGMNNNVTSPFTLTAVNGNNFMLPSLNLFIDNGSFTAYTGCNSAVGTIVVNGNSLHFEETTPSTNVECIGGFDQSAFIDRLRRADSYDVVNNQFRLKQGDQVLMVFQKNAQ